MKDKIAEMQYGKGAVNVFGKILVQERTANLEVKKMGVEVGNLITGVVVTCDGKTLLSRVRAKDVADANFDESLEMWEVELVIIPKRKFRINATEESFASLEVTQMLAGGWWNSENWKEQIFPKKKNETQ